MGKTKLLNHENGSIFLETLFDLNNLVFRWSLVQIVDV